VASVEGNDADSVAGGRLVTLLAGRLGADGVVRRLR
jgi:hypothetical protein